MDFGSNVHMTSHPDNRTQRQSIVKKRIFGNNGHRHDPMSGVTRLLMQKRKMVEIYIKNVLWVPGLPCLLLSVETIIGHRAELVNSEYQRIHMTLRRCRPAIQLEESNDFMTL